MKNALRRSNRISDARRIALAVLGQVAQGAYASDTLRESTVESDTRDAGLAGQIVFGVLRFQNQLDYLIERYSKRGVSSFDLPVLIALRAAIFQLRYLDRIPAHAAVNEAVEYVKTQQRAAAGLVNAVLRKVNREPVNWPDDSVAYSCPGWLLRKWQKQYGSEQGIDIARAALCEPDRYIRIPPGHSVPDGIQVEPTNIAGCYRLLSSDSTGYRLHDIGSQAILDLLDLQPEHTFLDLCSAPGNKLRQALEANPKFVVACDISERRLRNVNLAIPCLMLDASYPLPLAQKFDRILLDVPCSGTGTLGRNPEIKWQLSVNELARHQARQSAILANAANWLTDQGKVLYVTCSMEEDECENVIRQANVQRLLIEIATQKRLPGKDSGDGFYSSLLVKRSSVA